jgi:hypothetical protein
MRLFDNREEYEHALKLYEEYERDQATYLQYL